MQVYSVWQWVDPRANLGGGHAKLLKLLRVLDRVLHHFLQLPLHTLQPADVIPRHVGHLQCRWAIDCCWTRRRLLAQQQCRRGMQDGGGQRAALRGLWTTWACS